MPAGLLLIFACISVLLLATVITSVVAANWFKNHNNYRWGYWCLVFAGFGIFVLLKLVYSLPFAGGIIMGIMASMAFGAILLSIPWKAKTAGLAAKHSV